MKPNLNWFRIFEYLKQNYLIVDSLMFQWIHYISAQRFALLDFCNVVNKRFWQGLNSVFDFLFAIFRFNWEYFKDGTRLNEILI